MIWKTSKTIIKNLVSDAWDEEWLESLTGNDQEVLLALESVKSELWQEGYITLDTTSLTLKDFNNIRLAAADRMLWLVAVEED